VRACVRACVRLVLLATYRSLGAPRARTHTTQSIPSCTHQLLKAFLR
jgi:hypothetical protein